MYIRVTKLPGGFLTSQIDDGQRMIHVGVDTVLDRITEEVQVKVRALKDNEDIIIEVAINPPIAHQG